MTLQGTVRKLGDFKILKMGQNGCKHARTFAEPATHMFPHPSNMNNTMKY